MAKAPSYRSKQQLQSRQRLQRDADRSGVLQFAAEIDVHRSDECQCVSSHAIRQVGRLPDSRCPRAMPSDVDESSCGSPDPWYGPGCLISHIDVLSTDARQVAAIPKATLSLIPETLWSMHRSSPSPVRSSQRLSLTQLVSLSNGGIIYVSMQYRLGIFGFLGGAEIADNGVQNAGLLDQRSALDWVQRKDDVSLVVGGVR